jgi:hypothetical protein
MTTKTSTKTSTAAGPAWDAYLYALRALEFAEASYEVYRQRNLGSTAATPEIRNAGQLTTLAHNTVVNARRAVIEARRAYQLATALEDEAAL